MKRPLRLPRLLFPWVALLLSSLSSCAKEAPADEKGTSLTKSPAPQVAEAAEAPPPLTTAFVRRGIAALKAQLGPDAYLYEIRITGNVFSIQAAQGNSGGSLKDPSLAQSLLQFDYVEPPPLNGKASKGKVSEPKTVPIKGKGKLSENIFPYRDLHLPRMARNFKLAKLAVDPEDGVIERLVVRRFLPFSEGIRGRIFVRSPRMNGSIDVNEKGFPLKK